MSTPTSNAHYLVLDGAQIDDLYAHLYSLAEPPDIHPLYQNTAYAALADVGPVLMAFQPNSPLAQTFEQEWRATSGIWLESNAEPTVLIEHIRSLIHARIDDTSNVLLRFYDPRITSLWLGAMQPAEIDTLLGPINRLHVFSTRGEQTTYQRTGVASHSARYADSPWLRLSQEQLAQMNQAKLHCFDQRLLDHLRLHYPECLEGLNADQQQQWATQCRHNAAKYGYSSAKDVSRWASLCAELSNNFPQAPEHAPYRQLLEQRGQLPEQRLDNLITELHRQLLSADKESVA